MCADVPAKRTRFRELHRTGCFLIPNPWDIGSAKRLERMGFVALASTSSGSAWALGREDGDLSRDEVLQHLRTLCDHTSVPINADFEAGFADSLPDLAESVRLIIDTGVAGFSIEDFSNGKLYDLQEAAERIRCAREAIRTSGHDVVLVARAEGFLRGKPDLNDVIARLRAYSDAGADCLYAPGIYELGAIREIVSAVAPKSVNVLLHRPGLRVAELAEVGVRRISTGGALAAAAWAGFERTAKMLRDDGTMPPRA
jgi:2-methylisocitrate lyase-like PEP mutase family enzyme